MARQVGHCIRDERLQVEDSILLLKIITVARQAEHCIRDERLQVENSILLLKTITVARQAGHYIRDKRFQVQDSNLLLKISLWQDRQDTTLATRSYTLRIEFCY